MLYLQPRDLPATGPAAATGPPPRASGRRARAAGLACLALMRRGAPQVADRQGERVGGVGRAWPVGHPQQPRHHHRDLVLVGPAAAGHRRLDLARRVQRDRQPAPRGADDRDRPGLRGAHHGPHVVLAEHPLHGHRVGPVLGQPALDLLLDRQQPGRDVLVGVGAHHARRRPGSAAGRARPPPRRARTGSGRGRRRTRGTSAAARRTGSPRPPGHRALTVRLRANICSPTLPRCTPAAPASCPVSPPSWPHRLAARAAGLRDFEDLG